MINDKSLLFTFLYDILGNYNWFWFSFLFIGIYSRKHIGLGLYTIFAENIPIAWQPPLGYSERAKTRMYLLFITV